MVALQPDYWTELSLEEAWKLVDELVAEGYLRKYYAERTVTHRYGGGLTVKRETWGHDWIGLTAKGWAVAHMYLNA